MAPDKTRDSVREEVQLSVWNFESSGRLDRFLCDCGFFGSIRNSKLSVERGAVTLNQQRTTAASCRLKKGDALSVVYAPETPSLSKNTNGTLDIVFENEDFWILNKATGILSVPADGEKGESLLTALEEHAGQSVGAVHRLDRDTSGLILYAKTVAATQQLSELFKQRKIKKTYLAIAHVAPRERLRDSGVWRSWQRQVVKGPPKLWGSVRNGDPSAKEAITEFRTRAVDGAFAMLELRPKTGRTHQLRVHCSENRLPILGDILYGDSRRDRELKVPRLMLHAAKLEVPWRGSVLRLECPLPEDFETFAPHRRSGHR